LRKIIPELFSDSTLVKLLL